MADHNECKDTFQDHENCWLTDQCNIVFAHYGEPQNSIDIEFDLMCKDNFETYEERFHSEAWEGCIYTDFREGYTHSEASEPGKRNAHSEAW